LEWTSVVQMTWPVTITTHMKVNARCVGFAPLMFNPTWTGYKNNVRSPAAKIRTNECFYGNEQKFWKYIQNNKFTFKTLSFIWTIQTNSNSKFSYLQDVEIVRNFKHLCVQHRHYSICKKTTTQFTIKLKFLF
jgi:hypothetical protein